MERDPREGRGLVPVGSVVSIEGLPPIVVVGRALRDADGLVWDYLGAPYPEGLASAEGAVLLSRDMVREVLFEGCRSKRDDALAEAIDAYLAGDAGASWPPEGDEEEGG